MKPEGSHPATIWSGVCRSGFESAVKAMRSEPGPSRGRPRWILKEAPAARSASAAGRPSGPVSPSKTSPREWATMNQGGMPAAVSAPIIEPADVPTMNSALPGSHSVSFASALRPPVSHAPPSTPPAPSTNPTLTDSRFPSKSGVQTPEASRSAPVQGKPLGLALLRVRVGGLLPGRRHVVVEGCVCVAVEGLERDQAQALPRRGALMEVSTRHLRDARTVRCRRLRRGVEARHSRPVACIVAARRDAERDVARVAPARYPHPACRANPLVAALAPLAALEMTVRARADPGAPVRIDPDEDTLPVVAVKARVVRSARHELAEARQDPRALPGAVGAGHRAVRVRVVEPVLEIEPAVTPDHVREGGGAGATAGASALADVGVQTRVVRSVRATGPAAAPPMHRQLALAGFVDEIGSLLANRPGQLLAVRERQSLLRVVAAAGGCAHEVMRQKAAHCARVDH